MNCRRKNILHKFQIHTHEVDYYGTPNTVVTAGCVCGWDYYLGAAPQKNFWTTYKILTPEVDAKIEANMKIEYYKHL